MTAGRLGCLIVLVPVVDVVLLVLAAVAWGWWPVLVIVVLGFTLGLVVVRLAAQATGRSWAQALRTMQQDRDGTGGPETIVAVTSAGATGSMPHQASSSPPPTAQTVLLIPAGLLIALPGFLTDAAGLIMLIPSVRRRIARGWERRLRPR